MGRNGALAAALVVALGAACLALVVVSGMLELGAALVVAVVIVTVPGYLVSRAITPGGWGDGLMQAVASIALGFAIAVIGGIALDRIGIGLSAPAWAILLVVAGLGGAAVWYLRAAWLRAGGVDPRSRGVRRGGHVRDAAPPGDGRWLPRPVELSILVVALVLAAASIRIARVGLADQPQPGFTQLWMLPAASAGQLDLGITNEEGSREGYRLEVIRGTRTLASTSIDLGDGATWSASMPVPTTGSGPVEARLYRSTDPTHVYRSVSYWPQG